MITKLTALKMLTSVVF